MNDDDILPGAEPFHFEGNDIGVLVCHGFTGTPQSMRPLGERLAQAGYTVIGPRLAGHGITPQAMARSTVSDWIASVDEALASLQQRCSQVFMAGLSMGGTLTLYSAAKHTELIRGAITINASVQSNAPDRANLTFDSHAPETVPGIGSDIKAPGVSELAYREVPVAAFRQIYSLLGVTRDLLPRVRCPTLVLQSRTDHVVDPRNGPRIVRLIGAPRVELQWLDNSYHVATLDNDRELIADKTIAFIRSITGH